MSKETHELAQKHGVDQGKLMPIVERAMKDKQFAQQLLSQPDAALASFALNQREANVVKAITRQDLDEAIAAAKSEAQKKGQPDVAGQSSALEYEGARFAVGHAMLETLGGRTLGGHWSSSVGSSVAGCCAWKPCDG
jgi:hypothetical protein